MSVEVRRAGPADAEAIAEAHRHSIDVIGARYYDAGVVRDWAALVRGDLYRDAMADGEAFFVAVDPSAAGPAHVLGFSSHRVDDGVHGVAVYVRGDAVRRGIGSTLLGAAEASAAAGGAVRIEIDASLAAVEFYRAHGFAEIGRGSHPLAHGRAMACVFMRKTLAAPISASRASRRPSAR